MTLSEDLRTKYGLTSLKINGNCLPLTAVNEALERAAQIADRCGAPAAANQIRVLKGAPVNTVRSDLENARDIA